MVRRIVATRRGGWVAVAVGALLWLPACAPRLTAPPTAPSPRYQDFVFPSVPPGLSAPPVTAAHDLAWQWLQASDRTAACVSALHGEGRAELLDMVTSRLALDTRRVRFDFDSRNEGDRDRIARVYRHARVLSHVAVDHRVSIEADVPRRLLSRFESSTTDG